MANTPNVPNNTTGTAIAGIKVARIFCRKMYITITTSKMASISVFTTSSTETLIKSVLSFGYAILYPSGKFNSNSAALAFTRSAVASALAPGASITAIPAAGWPFKRVVTL